MLENRILNPNTGRCPLWTETIMYRKYREDLPLMFELMKTRLILNWDMRFLISYSRTEENDAVTMTILSGNFVLMLPDLVVLTWPRQDSSLQSSFAYSLGL